MSSVMMADHKAVRSCPICFTTT